MRVRLRRPPPLLAVTAAATVLLGTAALLVVLGALALLGGLDRDAVLAAVAGGAATLLATVAVLVAVGVGLARALQALRADAVARLEDPASAPTGRRPLLLRVGATPEIAELARVLDALHLRVRVGDEVAERHRRTAEAASAGMAELLAGLVAAEEGARGQLAAELHDTVAQSLLAARQLLHTEPDPVATGTAATEKSAARVGQASDLLDEAEEQVRAVMARTRPPELRRGDLAAAVGAAADDLERRYGLRVRLSWPEHAHPLPLAAAVVVYRFFQETLLNVVKHTDGDTADATLRVDNNGLIAEVSDAGPGFDPVVDAAAGGRHVGLALLRERARLAGGSVTIESSPVNGTVVRLVLPASALAGVVRRARVTAGAAT